MKLPLYISIAALCITAGAGAAEATRRAPADTLRSICLNELSVTSIKQGNSLGYQAVSSSSISRADIESQRITDAKTASNLVPNFFMPDYGSRITASVYVRGLGARIDQPVVGMNIDNVPIMNKDNYDFDLPDIDRIEMLRGSQGTLFGRNTMGGLINIYTLSPLSYQGTRALASYSTGNSWRVGASHYAKPSDKLGISVSAYYRSTDGFFTNQHNGQKCDWEHQGGGRIKAQWRPSHRVSIDNVLSLSVVRQGGYPYELVSQNNTMVGTFTPGIISYNDTCFYRRTSVTEGLTIGLSLGSVQLSSITSYQYIDDNMTLDQDFLPASYFTLTQAKREHAITQDFIAKGSAGTRYSWLGGLFGFFKTCDMDAPVTFLNDGIDQLIEYNYNSHSPNDRIEWDSRRFVLGSNFTISNYGAALYHQSTLRLGDFTLLAGLRLDYEHAALDYLSHCSTGYTVINRATNNPILHRPVEINDPGSLSESFLELLPKFSVTYDIPCATKARVYLSAAKGYKAGGFNTQMFSDVLQNRIIETMGLIGSSYKVNEIITYKPEHSWTFEAGTHSEWLDNRLHTDISAFYIHCTDQQLTVFPEGNTTGRVMTNAGKTRSCGVEIAIRAFPTNRLSLSASYGYTNARFIEFNNGKQDFANNFIPYAPQSTIFAAANYRIPVGTEWLRHIVLGADVSGAGRIYWNEENDISQSLYALLGAKVSLVSKNFSLDFWGANLTDTDYRTFYFMSINNSFLQRGRPRQLGVTLRMNIQ
ncbi:MAG: TonB-dependent receptor [Bacteroidales bacterium]|nr:TonB-dependent receptor [Bacteroidales bacterium]